jgi:hypothetical protein
MFYVYVKDNRTSENINVYDAPTFNVVILEFYKVS